MKRHPVSFRFKRAAGTTILAVALLTCFASSASAVSIDFGASTYAATVDPSFLSTGIDASQLYERSGSSPFDFTRPKLLNLSKALAPAYLRLSGTKIDDTYYDSTNLIPSTLPPLNYKYVMHQDEWDAANKFAEDAGFKVMAAVNGGNGPRNLDDSWNSTNARSMIQRAVDQHYPIAAIMFGNEPNQVLAANHRPSTYDAADYDKDLTAFLKLKDELLPSARFVGPGGFFTTGGERSLLGAKFGPDISDIMAASGSKYDVVSYHQYPAFAKAGQCASIPVSPLVPADTLSAEFLDRDEGAFKYMSGLRDKDAPGKPLWIDESGSAACGGVPGYSDTYASSFYYLNSLGWLSQSGLGLTTRWTLAGTQPYALIDDTTLTPRPDYWAAVLWKKLMGDVTLSPKVDSTDPDVRVYSHCLAAGAPGGAPAGSVASMVLNTSHSATKTVDLGADTQASLYLMTGSLTGGDVALNGTVLAADASGNLPAIAGKPVAGGTFTLPPASYAFVTTPDAKSEPCGSPHVNTKTVVHLTVAKQSLRKIKRTGRVVTRCRIDGAGTCAVVATLNRKQARKLRLVGKKSKVKTVRIGSKKSKLAAGKTGVLTLKLRGKALRALRKAPQKFRPRVRLVATGKDTAADLPATARTVLKLRR